MVQSIVKFLLLTLVVLSLVSCGSDSSSTADTNEIRVIESDINSLKMNFPNVLPKYAWSPVYGESVAYYLNERSELNSILYADLSDYDLRLLHCHGYKQASLNDRKKFWILYLASIAHAESHLNPNTTFREKDGTLSSGLLQIDVATANRHSLMYTGFVFSQKHLFNTDLNLMSGLYVLKHQLQGGMNGERPDVRGRLFTDRSYYWSVLTLKREMIIKTFTSNARINLPFCSAGR